MALLLACSCWLAATRPPATPNHSDQARIVVAAVNRLTWGARPGEIEAIEKMGLNKWLDQQLHPERIQEDPDLAARLEPLASLRMSPAEVIAAYPPAAAVRQIAQGKRPLPRDPQLRAVVERDVANYRARRDGQPAPAAAAGGAAPARPALLPLAQARDEFYQQRPQQIPAFDLQAGKLLRAVYTRRQLEDVLTDFWFNHFNIYLRKGDDSELIASFERDAIRPHVLGKFHDLLLATAESPAMMFYLDNWQSVDPRVNKRGINENYGRELMELHTLGVDTGYTQQDVIAVARCFTGWTIRQPGREAMFFYNDRLHDHGAKVVLGVNIAAGGGMSDGLKVLDILARSPATAHHIAYELAQRFAADDPPQALVDRMTATYLHTDGDLRQVMETMLAAPEFWQAAEARNKIKSPLELVVSALRGVNAEITNPLALSQIIANLGEPLYGKEPPTGYPNTGAAWVSSSGLVGRMQFAQRLAGGRLPGVEVSWQPLTSAGPAGLAAQLLHEPLSPSAQGVVDSIPAQQTAEWATLVLGGPQFQKR
ncbi:MAG: DUF1800 domain-containing protein [Terriglobales bacterium]